MQAQDKQGISALHVAAIHNQVKIALMLIDAGANLRCIDNEQSTPLHHACSEGNVELVQSFFEAGAKSPEAWVMISNVSICFSLAKVFFMLLMGVREWGWVVGSMCFCLAKLFFFHVVNGCHRMGVACGLVCTNMLINARIGVNRWMHSCMHPKQQMQTYMCTHTHTNGHPKPSLQTLYAVL